MLKIPSWRTFPQYEVTAFVDDAMFWKYYLIPHYVSIRTDQHGKPVFQLIAFTFGDQDREENKNLPRGGGYLQLDTELRVRAEDLDPIVTQLQKDTDEVWHQLKAIADAAGRDVRGYSITSDHRINGKDFKVALTVDDVLLGLDPGRPEAPPGDAPPHVVLADPTWCEGTFSLSSVGRGDLVLGARKEGPLSLLGTNVASGNMDLTAAGADFMVQTLVNPDGQGVDIVPISALYQMKMWARVPPVRVHASADSRKLYASVRSIYHDYQDNGCDEDTMTHSDQTLTMAVQSGLIDLRVEKGDPDVPDEVVNQMASDAQKAIQQLLTQKFFEAKPAPTPADQDPTKDYANADHEIYYLKTEETVDFTHFEYDEELSSVRKWPVNPQGTLQAFLTGLAPDEVKQFVRKVSLDDPFFQTLGLRVRAFGVDWDHDPVDFVEVELTYQGTDENNAPVTKATTALFTKDAPEFVWDPSLIGAKREFSYRWRVGYRGHGPSEWSAPETSTSNRLNFEVSPPGRVALDVMAGNLDFVNTTKSVQVRVSYDDPAHGIPAEGTTFVLDQASAHHAYERWIFAPRASQATIATTFFLKNDQQVDVPAAATSDTTVLINEPRTDNRVDLRLVPTGDWSQVTQAVVSLRYADPVNQVNAEGSFLFKAANEFHTWAVYVAPGGPRTLQYQVLTSFADGSSDSSDWATVAGDATLPIAVKQKPALTVTVNPILVDFAVTPVVEVTLRYLDAAHAVDEQKTFALSKPELQTWRVPLADPAKRAFTAEVTYYRADGQQVHVPPAPSDDDQLVVPKLLVPTVGAQVIAKMIDFTATPVVTVDLHYADPAHGIDRSETLVFTDPTAQQWRIETAEGGPTSYTVAVTYSLADGSTVSRPAVTLASNVVMVPRYVKEA